MINNRNNQKMVYPSPPGGVDGNQLPPPPREIMGGMGMYPLNFDNPLS